MLKISRSLVFSLTFILFSVPSFASKIDSIPPGTISVQFSETIELSSGEVAPPILSSDGKNYCQLSSRFHNYTIPKDASILLGQAVTHTETRKFTFPFHTIPSIQLTCFLSSEVFSEEIPLRQLEDLFNKKMLLSLNFKSSEDGRAQFLHSIPHLIFQVFHNEKRILTESERNLVQDLLEKGAFVDERDPMFGSTPLMFAVQRGDLDTVRLLLSYGADPKAKNGQRTMEHYAAQSNKVEIFIELSKTAKSIPILVSYINGSLERKLWTEERTIVQELLRNGALVDERDSKYGSTSLMFAAQRGDLETVRLLLSHGADPKAKNGDQTVESYAAQSYRSEIIVELAKSTQSIPTLVSYINGSLVRKLSKEERAMVLELLKNGALVDERDSKYGSTSLMFAAQRGDLETVRLLLSHGADPKAKNGDRSVEFYSAQSMNAEVIAEIARAIQ